MNGPNFQNQIFNGNQRSGGSVLVPATPYLNQWAQVSLVVQGNNANMYVNGKLMGSEKITIPNYNVIRTQNYIGDQNINVVLDWVGIVNQAASQKNMLDFYKGSSVSNGVAFSNTCFKTGVNIYNFYFYVLFYYF